MNHITPGHVRAFQAVRSPLYYNITLASCLVDDDAEPPVVIRPLFVAVTKRMTLAFAVPETKGD